MAGEQWALDWAFERCDDGAPMICTGCGSTRSLEYIYTLGPKVMSCCPERKMVSVTARITALEAEVARLRGEREAFSDKLDTERYKVAFGVQVILRAVQGRQWLSEPGRGSYTYDDERYQAEFGAALKEIEDALQPLRKIARDFSGCPSDPLRVAANRAAALNERKLYT